MRLLTICFFLATNLTAIAQSDPPRNWVHTEAEYKDSSGRKLKIINSLPRGGGYIHSGGKDYSYVVFWNRIINESASPVKISLKFPVDSFPIFPSPESYIKILIPDHTMTMEQSQVLDYGVTNMKSILDNGFKKPSVLEKTIAPKEEYLFNIIIFIQKASGTARTALVLKEHELSYKVSIDPHAAVIPCGRIEFKK